MEDKEWLGSIPGERPQTAVNFYLSNASEQKDWLRACKCLIEIGVKLMPRYYSFTQAKEPIASPKSYLLHLVYLIRV